MPRNASRTSSLARSSSDRPDRTIRPVWRTYARSLTSRHSPTFCSGSKMVCPRPRGLHLRHACYKGPLKDCCAQDAPQEGRFTEVPLLSFEGQIVPLGDTAVVIALGEEIDV